jgi:hypothetical protein
MAHGEARAASLSDITSSRAGPGRLDVDADARQPRSAEPANLGVLGSTPMSTTPSTLWWRRA